MPEDNLDDIVDALSNGTGKVHTDYTRAFEAEMAVICAPTPGTRIHTAYMDEGAICFTMIRDKWHRWYAIHPKQSETAAECALRAYFTCVLAPDPIFTKDHVRDHLETAKRIDPDLIPMMQSLYSGEGEQWGTAVAECVIVMQGFREFNRLRYIGGVEIVNGSYTFIHKKRWQD